MTVAAASSTAVPVKRFSLRSPLPGKTLSCSRLLDDDRPLQMISGDEIAAQFQMGPFFIVVSTYDYFDAASHWFYLLRADGRIIDAVSTPDYFGHIQNIDLTQRGRLSFGFFGTNDRWTLDVRDTGEWSFAYRDLVRRINRFVLCKRYLTLTGHKGPPWKLD